MRFLCCEDNATFRKIIELMLAPTGVDIDFATNGKEGVDAFATKAYDGVLMDMEMPFMNGIEATRAIRAIEAADGTDPVPILFLSGHEGPEIVQRTLNAGGTGFLLKPFTAEGLINALDHVLRTAQRTEVTELVRALR